MVRRGIIYSLIWCLLSFPVCFTDKLSPDQKASLFERGSGGLILKPPFESKQKVAASPSVSTNVINGNGVERKEIATFKLVDGELFRVVEGSFSYKSPEGIPISVHYTAGENENRVSEIRLGIAATEETGHLIRFPRQENITSTKTNNDRSYLPPQLNHAETPRQTNEENGDKNNIYLPPPPRTPPPLTPSPLTPPPRTPPPRTPPPQPPQRVGYNLKDLNE